MNVLKLFCKEAGAPKAFIVYPRPAQTKKEVRQFLNKVEITLRILKELT